MLEKEVNRVFVKTYELGAAISATPAYIKMRDAEEAEQQDPDVLQAARIDFQTLMKQVNQILEFAISGRIDTGDECGGSCDSCAGCAGRV